MKKLLKKIIPKTIIYKYKLYKESLKSKMNDKQRREHISNKYYEVYNKVLNWNDPKTYSEKMNVSKYLNSNNIKTKLTDKYEVREWIKEKVGEEYLIPIIGVYNSFEEINFNELPNQFVIKCSHDSGSVTIVNDKNNIDYKKLANDYNFYMKRNLAFEEFEMHYLDIKPRIIIEKYMGNALRDYKFLCFGGKPYFVWVDFDRFDNHKRNVYDMNWNLQRWNQRDYGNYEKEVLPPTCFEEMKRIVDVLAKDFDHVRVDLYDIDGKVYFGEMTFTNGSGLEPITPSEYDLKLGELWNLDINNKE